MINILILLITILISGQVFSARPGLSREIFACINHEFRSAENFPLNQEDMLAARGDTFVFNPNKLEWRAYDAYGNMIRSGRASGGKAYCPDVKRRCRTPQGKFKIYYRRGANCVSSKFPLNRRLPRAKMPYCSFFYRGFAIHGSHDVPNYNASHGCIRVPPEDARWLWHNFLHPGTKVIVKPYL